MTRCCNDRHAFWVHTVASTLRRKRLALGRVFLFVGFIGALQACGSGGSSEGPAAPDGGATVTWRVTGELSGLASSTVNLHLISGAGTSIITVGNGSFEFPVRVPNGSDWDVGAQPDSLPTDPHQRCDLAERPVERIESDLHVRVICRNSYSVGGRVEGLHGTGLILHMDYVGDLDLFVYDEIETNRDFTFFRRLVDGESYEVKVYQAPSGPTQGCVIDNATGVIAGADIANVIVRCGEAQLSYSVEGLAGDGLIVGLSAETDDAPDQEPPSLHPAEQHPVPADGQYSFDYLFEDNQAYEVRIVQQPQAPEQECEVVDATGRIGANAPLPTVRCPTVLRKYRFDNSQTIDDAEGLVAGSISAGPLYVEHAFENGAAIPLGVVSGFADEEIFQALIDREPRTSAIYSNTSGFTYWLAAVSPSPRYNTRPRIMSHWASLDTHWRMRKKSADAKFTLEFTEVHALGHYDTASIHTAMMMATALQAIRAYTYRSDGTIDSAGPFYSIQGGISLLGVSNDGTTVKWELREETLATADHELWSINDFDLDPARGVTSHVPQQVAYMSLREPFVVEVDLSSIPVGSEFLVVSETMIRANNALSEEGGSAIFLRDPGEFEPGASDGGVRVVDASGLELLPLDEIPEGAHNTSTAPLPACTLPEGQRSTLEFDALDYRVDESIDGDRAAVRVRRVGPADGTVAATVVISAGSATAGEDFNAVQLPVRFGDGSTASRTIEVPILDDELVEGDETLTLRLESPQGCATIGNQSTTTVTIIDDDEAPAQTYRLSGTVTGLVGSGLTLSNVSTDVIEIASNGPFNWSREFASGAPYIVRVATQPQNPRQSCTVENGDGFFADADVHILVTCETLPEASSLDPSFGTNGRVDAGAFPAARAMALQTDDKIVVLGTGRLGRFESNGVFDATFGAGGEVPVQFFSTSRDRLNALAVQADGQLVIAGYSSSSAVSPTQEDFIAGRFDANGNPDVTFGINGQVVTDFDAGGDGGESVVLLPDGRIVVSGNAAINVGGLRDWNLAAARYNVDGTLDTSFDADGRAQVDVGGRSDIGYASVLQPDGKLVIAGRVAPSGGSDPDVGLVRFNTDGSLDATFGSGGIVRDVTGSWDEAADLVLQADGKLVIAGHLDEIGADSQALIARYNPDGTPDMSFGTNGRVTNSAMVFGRALALQADGSIVIAGEANGDFVIARHNASGQLDPSFGTNGSMTIDFFGGYDTPAAIAVQSDGRIVVAGSAVNGTRDVLGLVRVVP